jgi:hypothetical protein
VLLERDDVDSLLLLAAVVWPTRADDEVAQAIARQLEVAKNRQSAASPLSSGRRARRRRSSVDAGLVVR